jgi:hypothetical protein
MEIVFCERQHWFVNNTIDIGVVNATWFANSAVKRAKTNKNALQRNNTSAALTQSTVTVPAAPTSTGCDVRCTTLPSSACRTDETATATATASSSSPAVTWKTPVSVDWPPPSGNSTVSLSTTSNALRGAAAAAPSAAALPFAFFDCFLGGGNATSVHDTTVAASERSNWLPGNCEYTSTIF